MFANARNATAGPIGWLRPRRSAKGAARTVQRIRNLPVPQSVLRAFIRRRSFVTATPGNSELYCEIDFVGLSVAPAWTWLDHICQFATLAKAA